MMGTNTAAGLIGRTAARAITTAGSASFSSCRGMTSMSARPAGTSNVSLSCARAKNSGAVTNGGSCQELSVMQSHLRRKDWRIRLDGEITLSRILKAKVGARERSTLHCFFAGWRRVSERDGPDNRVLSKRFEMNVVVVTETGQ